VRERLLEVLGQSGPQTGAELVSALRADTFAVWRTCRTTPQLTLRTVGRRYVRLDRKVEGYARLSPSIQREFLTYTVIGTVGDEVAVQERAAALAEHITRTSRRKLELARSILGEVVEAVAADQFAHQICVLVAGDVVYNMAHDVDRPERSTGTLVNGSDLDIVVIVADDADEGLADQLDDAIYKKKHQYLSSPAFREEIDYVVKPFATLVEQAEFDDFRRMVACKIYDEAVLLYGSERLFDAGKRLLAERGVLDRLRAMEADAIAARETSEQALLSAGDRSLTAADLLLFHTEDESEEFE
jgi:hypothetical protein